MNKPKNRAAQQLGRMARGVPKRFSAEEIAKRTIRIKSVQAIRAASLREAKLNRMPKGAETMPLP
jgi:hypothetical protein